MAGKKVRMGIAGMTSDHVWDMGDRLAALPNVEFVAAAESYPGLAEEAQEHFGLQRVYADYVEMLENEELDAILVCSDNASKVGYVREAAKRGVHVCQDKPIAATLAQAAEIAAIAEQSGIKVMIAYHNYFSAGYGQTKEWLQAGKIGSVYLARGVIGHAGPREVGCPESFCEWLFDEKRNGGGTFVDEGCYVVSAFLDYLGPVAEVCAFTAQIGFRDYLPADVEDNSVAILRFRSGALGIIDAKWGQIGPMPFGSSYHGTDGTILVGRGELKLYSRAGASAEPQGWVDVPAPRGASRPGIGSEAEYFINCLVEDNPIEGAVSPQGAVATQEVIEAVYRSARSHQVVKLPL